MSYMHLPNLVTVGSIMSYRSRLESRFFGARIFFPQNFRQQKILDGIFFPAWGTAFESNSNNQTHITMGFLEEDLLHPSKESEQLKHKKKRLVPEPNSYFLDVKCPGCFKMFSIFFFCFFLHSKIFMKF